ncbi:unnamed protein product, partial [Meganyctiphanes norvegica]
TMDLGSVSNAEATNETLVLVVKAALVHYSGAADDDKVKLYMGADYTNKEFVWLGLFEYTAQISTEATPSYTTSVTCDPSELEVDFFTVCTASLSTADAFSSTLKFEVNAANLDTIMPYTYSIGSMKEVSYGAEYSQPPTTHSGTASYTANKLDWHYREGVEIDLGLVTKSTGASALDIDIVIYSNRDPSYVGQVVTLNLTVVIESAVAGQDTHDLTLVEETTTQVPLTSDMITIDLLKQDVSNQLKVPPGGLALYEVKVDLNGHEKEKTKMILTTSTSVNFASTCSMVFASRGKNMQYHGFATSNG